MPRDVSLLDSKCWNDGHEWVNMNSVNRQSVEFSKFTDITQLLHGIFPIFFTTFQNIFAWQKCIHLNCNFVCCMTSDTYIKIYANTYILNRKLKPHLYMIKLVENNIFESDFQNFCE